MRSLKFGRRNGRTPNEDLIANLKAHQVLAHHQRPGIVARVSAITSSIEGDETGAVRYRLRFSAEVNPNE
jgi:hypothetical protein